MKRGLMWSVMATVCGAIGSVFVTPLLVTQLGPGEFGVYVVVLTLASCASFFDCGFTWAAGRYLADDAATGRRTDLIGRFFTLVHFFIGVGLLSVAAALIVGPSILRRAGVAVATSILVSLALAAMSFALTLQIGLLGTLLRSCQQFEAAGRMNTIASLLLPLTTYLALQTSARLNGLLVVNLVANGAILSLFVARSRRELDTPYPVVRWAPRYLKEMAVFGGWTTATRACGLMILQLDRLAVALLGSVTGVTYYAVPASVASRVNSVGSTAAGLFFTRASALHAAGAGLALRQQHAAATRLLGWVAGAARTPLVMLGHECVRAWIGPEMAVQGTPILATLVIGYAVMAVGSLDSVTLEGCGRPDLTGLSVLAWSAAAIVVVLFLGPTLGARAAAYAVGGWLAGVGLTSMVLTRAVVLGRGDEGIGFPAVGLALVVGTTAIATQLVRPMIDGLVSALAALSGAGCVALAVGFLVILSRRDRALVMDEIAVLVPALRGGLAAARNWGRPTGR